MTNRRWTATGNRQEPGDPRSPSTVRFFNDYAARWPLWTTFGGTRRSDWVVSDDLAARIEAWAAVFDVGYDPLDGWPDARQRDAQRAEGAELAGLLQTELGDGWWVRFEYWETAVARHR